MNCPHLTPHEAISRPTGFRGAAPATVTEGTALRYTEPTQHNSPAVSTLDRGRVVRKGVGGVLGTL